MNELIREALYPYPAGLAIVSKVAARHDAGGTPHELRRGINISRQHLLRAVAQTEIVCVQNLFNLADQRSLDVLAECRARDIAFVPFCPLGLPGEGRRRMLADPVLAAVAGRLGATPVQVALAWLLDLAPNILLIPGTRTRAHLAEDLGAAGVRLDDTDRAELTRHWSAEATRSPR